MFAKLMGICLSLDSPYHLPAAAAQVSNVTSEVSDCSAVDVSKCNQSFVLMHGVKSVPWQELCFFWGNWGDKRQELVG